MSSSQSLWGISDMLGITQKINETKDMSQHQTYIWGMAEYMKSFNQESEIEVYAGSDNDSAPMLVNR